MRDIIQSVLANSEAFRWLFMITLIWAFYRYMNAEGNPLRWWHYISSKGKDGQYYADLNKLGQVAGIAFGSLAVVQVSGNAKSDFVGFAAVLTAYFAFVGGVAGYAAFLRSKSNRSETTVVQEPVPDPATTKITTKTVEPIKEEVMK